MRYKLAVFDMDGTILNTLEDLADATNYALRECGMPEHSIDDVRRFVGNGMGKLIERAVVPGTDDEGRHEVRRKFAKYYHEHGTDKTAPYPGIPELLRNLRAAGCMTAVVSNKIDSAVQELCEHFFDGCFDYALGEREGIARKPAPDMCRYVLEQLGVDPSDAVYIGDSDVDVQTAENSGLDGIYVEWGFRGRDFLIEHGAQTICSTPEEVQELILGE